jgi:hypothetical protein
MEDNQTDNSPEEKPGREDTAEQEPRNEKYKEKAEHLFEAHRRNEILPPNLVIAILSVFLLFITALGALGVLAFYSGHNTTLEIIFIITIVLLLAVPISVIWYLRVMFRRKPEAKVEQAKKGVLDKLIETPFGMFLARFGSNLIVQILQYVFVIYMIADAIISVYPIHPRLSLAIIVVYMPLLLIPVMLRILFWYLSAHESEISNLWEYAAFLHKTDRKLLDALTEVVEVLNTRRQVAESSLESIGAIREAQVQLLESITATLKAMPFTKDIMPNSPNPDRENIPPEESRNERTVEDAATSKELDTKLTSPELEK